MSRRFAAIVTLGLAGALAAGQSGAKSIKPITVPRRVALVIGNSHYRIIPSVPPAVNDADDMARALRDLGFDSVTVEKDLTGDALISAVSHFTRTNVQPGDLALIYYSGHGGQVGEENYLLPVDYDPPSDEELVERRAYRMSQLRDSLERTGARVRVLVFDACRNSPVTTAKGGALGLRGMDAKPEGTIIAFASAHNQVARYDSRDRNSFYTAELLAALRQPQMDLKAAFEQAQRQVFERTDHLQTPFLYGFLSAPLYLNGSPAPIAQPSPVNVPGASPAERLLGSGIGTFRLGMTPEQLNQSLPHPFGNVAWTKLIVAQEYTTEVRYVVVHTPEFWSPASPGSPFAPFLPFEPCWGSSGYVVFLFDRSGLIRISVRFFADCGKRDQFTAAFADSLYIPAAGGLGTLRYRTILNRAVVEIRKTASNNMTAIEVFRAGSPAPVESFWGDVKY